MFILLNRLPPLPWP